MRDTNKTQIKNWLMLDLLGRKIRLHMQQIYEECGNEEGRELEHWLKAQSQALRTLNAG